MSNCSLAILESSGSPVTVIDVANCAEQCAPAGQLADTSTALLECALVPPSGSLTFGPCALACFGVETF